MSYLKLGILGGTGIVGREILNVIGERNIDFDTIRLLASKKSSGLNVKFKNKEIMVEEVTYDSFKGLDILLVAVNSKLSKIYTPIAVKEGVTVIDNSSAYRLDDDVPLVVPEVNCEDINNHKGIIANPNCSTIIALTALNELHKKANIKRMIVSTYQAVSGAGAKGLEELKTQISNIENNKDIKPEVFQHQIAYNLIPHIGDFDERGYSEEEIKMENEGRKIFHNPNLKVNCTCVRVPVFRSHSESITFETEKEITVKEAKKILKNSPGVKLVDNPENNYYPMPIKASNQDLVYVGRVRKDISQTGNNSLSLWCSGDQIRKGAATNAVQILEKLIEKKAY